MTLKSSIYRKSCSFTNYSWGSAHAFRLFSGVHPWGDRTTLLRGSTRTRFITILFRHKKILPSLIKYQTNHVMFHLGDSLNTSMRLAIGRIIVGLLSGTRFIQHQLSDAWVRRLPSYINMFLKMCLRTWCAIYYRILRGAQDWQGGVPMDTGEKNTMNKL